MAVCWMCGREFDVAEARRAYNRRYGAGTYDDEYDQDVCKECALDYAAENMAAGARVMGLMGTGWDDD